ncbi:hypothetical protein TRVL_08012 [Trypanosoma vivax]|nr:hypothetical protein TRVL_08012 [Trypanosoma vivax]
MVNAALTAIRDPAAMGSAMVNDVRCRADEALLRAAALGDKGIVRRVEEAGSVAHRACEQVYKTMIVFGDAVGVVIRSFSDRCLLFYGKGPLKDKAREFWSGFTPCEIEYCLNNFFLERVKRDLLQNASELDEWMNKTKDAWEREASRTLLVLKRTKSGAREEHWCAAWDTLNDHLGKVVTPLVSVTFNIAAAEDVIRAAEINLTRRVEAEAQHLMREHKALCKVSKQLDALSSAINALNEQASMHPSKIKKPLEATEKSVRTMHKRKNIMETVLPSSVSATMDKTAQHGNGHNTPHVRAEETTAKEVDADAIRLHEDVRDVNGKIAVASNALGARVTKVRERVFAISEEISERFAHGCNEVVGRATPRSPEAVLDELRGGFKGCDDCKVVEELDSIETGWKKVQQSPRKASEKANVAEATMKAAETKGKGIDEAVKREITSRRRDLCEEVSPCGGAVWCFVGRTLATDWVRSA